MKLAQDYSVEIVGLLYEQERRLNQKLVKYGKVRWGKTLTNEWGNNVNTEKGHHGVDDYIDESYDDEDIEGKYTKQLGKSRVLRTPRTRTGNNSRFIRKNVKSSLKEKNISKEQRSRKKLSYNRDIDSYLKYKCDDDGL